MYDFNGTNYNLADTIDAPAGYTNSNGYGLKTNWDGSMVIVEDYLYDDVSFSSALLAFQINFGYFLRV